MPLLDGLPHPASAQALTEVTALVMHRTDLAAAVQRDPQIALALVRLLATRLRDAFERIGRSSTPDALPRVAAAISGQLPDRSSPLPSLGLWVGDHECGRFRSLRSSRLIPVSTLVASVVATTASDSPVFHKSTSATITPAICARPSHKKQSAGTNDEDLAVARLLIESYFPDASAGNETRLP